MRERKLKEKSVKTGAKVDQETSAEGIKEQWQSPKLSNQLVEKTW
jgi:hypothetical protein